MATATETRNGIKALIEAREKKLKPTDDGYAPIGTEVPIPYLRARGGRLYLNRKGVETLLIKAPLEFQLRALKEDSRLMENSIEENAQRRVNEGRDKGAGIRKAAEEMLQKIEERKRQDAIEAEESRRLTEARKTIMEEFRQQHPEYTDPEVIENRLQYGYYQDPLFRALREKLQSA